MTYISQCIEVISATHILFLPGTELSQTDISKDSMQLLHKAKCKLFCILAILYVQICVVFKIF